MDPVANFRVFRAYLSRQTLEKNMPILVLYWDTPDKRKSLIDPYLYEHAASRDLESRVGVFKLNDAEGHFVQFSWQQVSNKEEDLEVGTALADLDESRRPDLQKFLGECWEAVERMPYAPFRATFR
jgi:hypothetical protein